MTGILPNELVDRIIDFLHKDNPSLKACSLVSSPWLVSSRFHRFNEVTLWKAAEKGNEAVVKLLLAREDVNINAKYGEEDKTALMYTTSVGVARLLMEQDGIDVNATDVDGWTALIYACSGGDEEFLRLLLSRNKFDINARTNIGETALIIAASNGNEAVVRLLLEREDLQVSVKDDYGCTALSSATPGVAQLLKIRLNIS